MIPNYTRFQAPSKPPSQSPSHPHPHRDPHPQTSQTPSPSQPQPQPQHQPQPQPQPQPHPQPSATAPASNKSINLLLLLIIPVIFVITGCSNEYDQTSFRVRSDITAGLNDDEGWAGEVNENVTMYTDEPFRIRFGIEGSSVDNSNHRFRLQYRRNGGRWRYVKAEDFPNPKRESPVVSIIEVDSYENGEETIPLLADTGAGFRAGSGVSLAAETVGWAGGSARSEFEWPLVIRRFSDDAVMAGEGDTFQFRMAGRFGSGFGTYVNPTLTLSVPDGHIGGTFVETPGRIGPWKSASGDLYFVIEPAATDNDLLMIKSSDFGESWEEADSENRPSIGDLEGFASYLRGDVIHILHQVSSETYYHTFRTSDHPENPDTWDVRDMRIAIHDSPPTQVAAITVRPDSAVVAVYGGPEKIRYRILSAEGLWSDEVNIDDGDNLILSGPQVVTGAGNEVHLAYYGDNGTAWYRRIEPDGTLTPPVLLASGLGTEPRDRGSILPLVWIPETKTVVVIYRLATGRLWERRITDGGMPGEPVRVSDRKVVQRAVDSDQAGADAIADGSAVHVLFIDESNRNIYHSITDAAGKWKPARLLVDGVDASWIRGSRYQRDGRSVYGFVYDAGSGGGGGMNKFAELPLGRM